MPTYKIHPAIGFARVGNSPDFFLGPEKRHQVLEPEGGFKDFVCRVKRQGARFRIFEYSDDFADPRPRQLDLAAGGFIVEWTVRLGSMESGWSVTASISGTNSVERVYSSTGLTRGWLVLELRTDKFGNLIVLGGYGRGVGDLVGRHADDTGDGEVRARLQRKPFYFPPLPAPGRVTSAWVVVAAPKFAIQHTEVVSLWDVAENRLHGERPVGPVSYLEHIYPLLLRAMEMRWLREDAVGHHGWELSDVASLPRRDIFHHLTQPSTKFEPAVIGGMPPHRPLTTLQYLRMREFYRAGNGEDSTFVDDSRKVTDWTTYPRPTEGEPGPFELDRAALEACNGGPFTVGIDVGNVFTEPYYFLSHEPLRVKPTLASGFLRGAPNRLEVPWHHDLIPICREHWPVMRPSEVLRQTPEGLERGEWSTLADTLDARLEHWDTLGFVVKDEATGSFVEQSCGVFRFEPPSGSEAFDPRWWVRFSPLLPRFGPPVFERLQNLRTRAILTLTRGAEGKPGDAPPGRGLRQRLLSKYFEARDRVEQFTSTLERFVRPKHSKRD